MRLSVKVSLATHILLATHFFAGTARITGKILTLSTGGNPVVIRTIVLALKKAGILEVTRGAAGGTRLKRPPEEITLYDIYRAVDSESLELSLKGIHAHSSPVCPIGQRIVPIMSEAYGKLAEAIRGEMSKVSLLSLSRDFTPDEIARHQALLLRNFPTVP
ncbi:MAG: Rrf2 family transcriptional regulator [Deltaproteobacteria bacterium]|jgi:DNA-binding IscR family transcriptional regulator|nr:Rrf2 family transcriptional regulator [Deltaproteobacteria bacterium]